MDMVNLENFDNKIVNSLLGDSRFQDLLNYVGGDTRIVYTDPQIYYAKATAFIGLNKNDQAFEVLLRLKIAQPTETQQIDEFILSFNLNDHNYGKGLDVTTEEVNSLLKSFLKVWESAQHLTQNDYGGMSIVDRFYIWYTIKKLRPKLIVESGVWRGIGTYFIENAAPEAKIISLDINLNFRHYVSEKVEYVQSDFYHIDWSIYAGIENSLVIFDDHQDCVRRLQEAHFFGFNRFVFQDNYADIVGHRADALSIKQAFSCYQFNFYENVKFPEPQGVEYSMNFYVNKMIQRYLNTPVSIGIRNGLKRLIKTYYEYPPIVPLPTFSEYYNSIYNKIGYVKQPLFTRDEVLGNKYLEQFYIQHYNFICFVEI